MRRAEGAPGRGIPPASAEIGCCPGTRAVGFSAVGRVDCLVIGAAEFDRGRERETFLRVHRGEATDGWGRFLALNYVEYEGDALMANQLASIAYRANHGPIVQ